MGLPVRALGTWIAAAIVAGSASAAQVASRPADPPPAEVATFAPRLEPGVPASTTVTSVTVPTEPSSTTTATPHAGTPRSTSTTAASNPAATGPVQVDAEGIWTGAVAGGQGRRLPGTCADGAIEWRHDGSAIDQEQLTIYGVHVVTQHGLDGSSRTVATGYGLVRSGNADLAAWVDPASLAVVLTDSDLRSHRVEIRPTDELQAAPTFVLRPDGQAVAISAAGRMAIYGRDGSLLQPWADVHGNVVTWTSDLRWIVVSDGPTGLAAIHPDGTGLHDIDIGVIPQHLALGPGAAFAYMDMDPDRATVPDTTGTTMPNSAVDRSPIVVVDVAAGTSRRIVQGRIFEVAWSPDGGPIVWSGERDGTYGLYATTADGASTRLLAAGVRHRVELPEIHDWTWETYDPRFPAISPDARTWAACA
jgi:hypothetical protein